MTSRVFLAVVVLASTPCLSPGAGGGETTPAQAQAQALNLIADFAERLCATAPVKGGNQSIELSGTAKADLANVLKKVADLGIEGAAKYTASDYQGVLQGDLAKLLEDASKCRLEVWRDLKDRLLPPGPQSSGSDGGNALDSFVESAAREASSCKGTDRECGLKKLAADRLAGRVQIARRIACNLDNDVRILEDSIPPGSGRDSVAGLTTGQLQKFLEVRNSAMQIRQVTTQAPFLPILPEVEAVSTVFQDNFGPPEIVSPDHPPTMAQTLEGKRNQFAALRGATKALRDRVRC